MTPWIETTLGSICDIKIGGTPSRSNPLFWDVNLNESNHWVSIRDLDQPRISSTAERITTLGVNRSNAKPVRKGTVLLSFKLTIGKVAIADVDLFTNEAIAALETGTIDNDFLFHGLHYWNLLQDVDQAIKGATLNKAKLFKIRIQIPEDRREQERIAEILSTVDAAIEHTQALIDKYGRIKRGLMQDLLTRGIDENGNIRTKETHRFIVKNGIEVPDEWDVVPIGLLSEPITSGSRGWAAHYTVEGAKFIRIGNLSREHIDFRLDNMVFVDPPDGAERLRTKLIEGDILVSITADLGMIGVIPKDFGAAYNNQHIARVRVSEGDTSPRWIGYFLLCENGQSQFQMLNESGAKAGLNLPTVASLLVAVPQGSEQLRIVEMLDSTLSAIECHRQTLVKLNAIKRGLMQDLLSGRKRVKVDA